MAAIFKTTTICAIALGLPTGVVANSQNTALLNEYLAMLGPIEAEITIGQTDEDANGTTLKDLLVVIEDGQMVLEVDWIKSETVDSGHMITYAPKSQMTILTEGTDAPFDDPIILNFIQEGGQVTVSGPKEARKMISEVASFEITSETNAPLNVDFSMRDIKTEMTRTAGEQGRSVGTFSMGQSDLAYGFQIEGEDMSTTTTATAVSGKFDTPNFDGMTKETLLTGFDISQDMSINYDMAQWTSKVNMTTQGIPLSYEMSAAKGSGLMGLVDQVAMIWGQSDDVKYKVNFPMMGIVDAQAQIGKAGSELRMPLFNQDAAAEARIRLDLSALTMSENIWAMFDPLGELPRDEANLMLDLGADVIWNSDLEGLMNYDGGLPPLRANSVALRMLSLDVAGASVMALGQADINNETFPPMPVGSLDVNLTGANGLLDKLLKIGLVPMEFGMMAKGMSAMFFKQGGQGPDHLITKVEMLETGGISVNGVPVR